MGAVITGGSKLQEPALSAAAVVAATAFALIVMELFFDVDARSLAICGAALLGTGVMGVLVALAAQRWTGRLGLSGQLTVFTALALTIAIANVMVAAALMFLSTHDLRVLIVLCGYALLATIGPAVLMTRSVSRRVGALREAAGEIASGRLTARVADGGNDEVSQLATAFNRMAEALGEANARRQELEQARRDLFAAISHDLRTPLASIRVMVEALADGVVDDEQTRMRYLKTMGVQTQQLSALIDDLFELATIDAGELSLRLELLKVEDVMRETLDTFQAQAEQAHIHLAFEPATGTLPVAADPQRLSRVLYNLLQNAIRHTPEEGTITLRTRSADNAVTVEVSDTGEGISPADALHVFDRFYRGEKSRSREFGGSGLGLSIARGIVEAHGGRIWVETGVTRGATVAFTLPAAAGAKG